MNFISLDLEWNCVKDHKTGKFVNEIIEIGAVKLNGRCKETGSFSAVVKPAMTKRLNHYVKRLTHITEAELAKGDPFDEVMRRFTKWAGRHSILITWSTTDLHVLLDNYKRFLHTDKIAFLSGYADLQKYVSRFIETKPGQQIALSDAAEQLGMDTTSYHLHRALDDSRLCGQLLQKTYDPGIFAAYTTVSKKGDLCQRLTFKPYYIDKPDSPDIDKEAYLLKCTACGEQAKRISPLKQERRVFSAEYQCPSCKQRYRMQVKFKKTYDSVLTSRSIQTLSAHRRRKRSRSAARTV